MPHNLDATIMVSIQTICIAPKDSALPVIQCFNHLCCQKVGFQNKVTYVSNSSHFIKYIMCGMYIKLVN